MTPSTPSTPSNPADATTPAHARPAPIGTAAPALQVALVGVAHIHTPDFVRRLRDRGGVAVKYVWDHQAPRARKYAEEAGAQVADDVNIIWSDPGISAVIIGSETNLHEGLVLAAVKAGKHLFVEKPLGMGSKDAYAMAKAIEKAGVIFQTGYFRRGNPQILFIREQVQKGNFGRITRMRASNCHGGATAGWFDTDWRWMADPKVAGCGAFGDLGTHILDVLIWIFGDVESVTARLSAGTTRYGDCDETGEGLIQFTSGAIGTLAAAWDDVANPVPFLVSGTEGHAAILNGQLFFQSKKVEAADGKSPVTSLLAPWPHAFDLFLDAVGGKPNIPLVSAREAAYRSAVMEALYEGAKKQKWVTPKVPMATGAKGAKVAVTSAGAR